MTKQLVSTDNASMPFPFLCTFFLSGDRKSVHKMVSKSLRSCLKIMKRVASAIAFYLGMAFNHPNVWLMKATETVSPSPWGEGRGEGGL
jgi:hypothetical protein